MKVFVDFDIIEVQEHLQSACNAFIDDLEKIREHESSVVMIAMGHLDPTGKLEVITSSPRDASKDVVAKYRRLFTTLLEHQDDLPEEVTDLMFSLPEPPEPARMKCYFTFGQVHVHRVGKHTVDKDCVAVIEGDSFEDCRDKAFEWFDDEFHGQYSQMPSPKIMQHYPRGLVYLNCEPPKAEVDWSKELREAEVEDE